ncbi:MAG: hypothetical protein M3203_04860 [Actinomycetota bacterium]|nr:hypothetical protein [Actinomycetota bacterium]
MVDPNTPGEDLDARVADAVARSATPSDIQDALGAQEGVVRVQVREGLVKTEPPVVEVVVDYLHAGGVINSRVYDLALDPDGTLRLRGHHSA